MNDIKDDPSLKTKLSFNKDKIINAPKKKSFKKKYFFIKRYIITIKKQTKIIQLNF